MEFFKQKPPINPPTGGCWGVPVFFLIFFLHFFGSPGASPLTFRRGPPVQVEGLAVPDELLQMDLQRKSELEKAANEPWGCAASWFLLLLLFCFFVFFVVGVAVVDPLVEGFSILPRI